MHARREVRETLKLAIPITFAQIALMTMGLVDVALVGRVSDVAVAAVATGNSLAFAMLCPAMGVTMAVEPLASQAVGAGDEQRAWMSYRAGLLACLVLFVPTILVTILSMSILTPLGVDPEVVPHARAFVYARLPGVLGWLFFMAAKAYLEARGITRPLFVGGWVGNVVNFVVCGFLVFGDRALAYVHLPGVGMPPLGSLGAGIATSFANWVLAGIALSAAWKARPEGASMTSGSREELVVTTKKLIRVGVPIGFQFFTEVGVFCLVSLLVGRLGASILAAHQIAIGLSSLTYMGVLGLGGATAVRVGRAVGAEEEGGPRRAGMVGIGLAGVYMGICALIFVIFPRPLARIFNADPVVIETAVTLLRVAAFFQIADGIQGCAGGALRGAADTKYASFANVVCHWFLGLPLSILFCFGMAKGAVGTWWGLSIGLIVVAGVLTLRFWRVSSRAIRAV